MTDAIAVITTLPTKEAADALARALVERRVAACVQVSGPIESTYRWQGKIESSQEWVCIIKTLASHYLIVEAAIRELHSYQVPEILAFPASAGSRSYLEWMAGELVDPAGPRVV